jgi:light-regulated signal transduction histidine kinase (bacteriophytochrome)
MSAARPSKKRPKLAGAARTDAIQPCGWLIVCNAQASVVLRHSANLGLLFPDGAESFIGASVSELLGSETAHGLRNALARFIGPARPALFLHRRLTGADGAFDVATSRAGDESLIEIEQAPPQSDRDAVDRLRAMIDRIDQATEVEKLLATAARLIFSVLQYDRVSILRFEDDGSARILAQQKSLDLVQNDLSADLTNTARPRLGGPRIRFIADHDAPPSPILGEEDGTPLDLTWSYLGAADVVERQALQRGGFLASLSLQLVVDGAVWGLVLCQDRAPRHPSLSVRAVAELFSDFVALQLQALLQKRTVK